MRDMTTVSKMGHTIIVGLPTLKVRRQNPPNGSEPPKANKARNEVTQGMATSWHFRSPIEGTQRPQASYLSLDREVSFTPDCGLASCCPGFLRGLPEKEA
jgi:hypothetical protein